MRYMSALPDISGVGTLVADPDLRFTPSGKAVANVTVAFNSRRKNQQTQEWEDGDTTFLRGSIWDKYAENVAESLTKGDKVFVVGTVKQREWEKDGVKRVTHEIAIEEFGPTLRFATAKVDRGSRDGGSSRSKPAAQDAGGDWGSSDEEPGW